MLKHLYQNVPMTIGTAKNTYHNFFNHLEQDYPRIGAVLVNRPILVIQQKM